jgi:hypothetical protein
MAEYYSKIIEHIIKITERYIKMTYSKHKMIEYHGDGGSTRPRAGSGGLVNTGSTHQLMQDESEAHPVRGSVGSAWARGSVGHARA